MQVILSKNNSLKNQHLVYLHGSAITLDFSAILFAKNIKVTSFLAYKTSSSDFFSDSLQQFLNTDNFNKIFQFCKSITGNSNPKTILFLKNRKRQF